MKTLIIVACGLLCGYSTVNNAKITPIKLETGMLALADGTFIDWTTIRLIKQYKIQLDQFMHTKYTFKNGSYNLLDCVKFQDSKALPADSNHVFTTMAQDFISFSEHFLNYLQSVKGALIPLIEEDCAERNRNHSLLLKWAHIPLGDEQKLFNAEITSYRALCTFCVDIICFLEDLMYSCPKAVKSYEQEVTYQRTIRSQIDELLTKDNRLLTSEQYRELLHIVSSQKKHVGKEAISTLYQNYIKTLCA